MLVLGGSLHEMRKNGVTIVVFYRKSVRLFQCVFSIAVSVASFLGLSWCANKVFMHGLVAWHFAIPHDSNMEEDPRWMCFKYDFGRICSSCFYLFFQMMRLDVMMAGLIS